MNSARSTEKAEKVVKAPQNPVVRAWKSFDSNEKRPTKMPRTQQPVTFNIKICQGQLPVAGSISNSPHLAQAPKTPPIKIEINALLFTRLTVLPKGKPTRFISLYFLSREIVELFKAMRRKV